MVAGSPPKRFHFAAELHRNGAKNKENEEQHERQIERAEHGCVDHGKSGEKSAAGRQEPHLVSVPDGTDGIDMNPPFVITSSEEVQHADPQIEPVQNGVTSNQHAEERKPGHIEVHYACTSLTGWLSLK